MTNILSQLDTTKKMLTLEDGVQMEAQNIHHLSLDVATSDDYVDGYTAWTNTIEIGVVGNHITSEYSQGSIEVQLGESKTWSKLKAEAFMYENPESVADRKRLAERGPVLLCFPADMFKGRYNRAYTEGAKGTIAVSVATVIGLVTSHDRTTGVVTIDCEGEIVQGHESRYNYALPKNAKEWADSQLAQA